MYIVILFTLALVASLAPLQANQNSLAESFQKIAENIANRDLVASEVAAAKLHMSNDEIVDNALDYILSSTDAKSEAAASRFIFALKPFPYIKLILRFENARNSSERAYSLHMLAWGLYLDERNGFSDPGMGEVIRGLASRVLYDKASGLRRYGEARAYSAEGGRVCDIAYNILIKSPQIKSTYPTIDVDNYSLGRRDKLIDKLGEELNLAKPSVWDKITGKKQAYTRPRGDGPATNVSDFAGGAEQTSSRTLWFIVLAVCATCVMVLRFVKWR